MLSSYNKAAHVDVILSQNTSLSAINRSEISKIKLQLKNEKQLELQKTLEQIKAKVEPKTKRCLELAAEKGASSWLTALPIPLQRLGYWT